jgi:nitrogen-specific signal transduction histidine kinase/CheY-like chemotaxis protein
MLVINYDVTERRRLEDDVLRSQRTETIGRLAGGIAHDLNNVLSPILVTASMLAECVDDDLREDVELIEDSARRGAAMVNQLLTFARGRETMRTSIDAREAVADVVRLMRETFPKSIDVAVEIEGEPTVHADPTQLDQVLTNLAVNARDALPAGGQITFRVRERFVAEPRDGGLAGSYVIFEIEDDGIGIKPEDMPSIFDPYFTTKPHGHGTGLGLSTSQGIVRGHGGFISVESTLNEGTKISAHFPSSTPTLDLESSVVQDSESTEKLAGQILVVDDEEAILRAATRTLELAGFEVVTARNGAEGIATFVQTDDVDLVITDVMMPQMGGHSTITAVRALNPEIPIIVWSGRVEQEALDEIRAEGIQGFLPKPFAMNDLVKMIRTALTHQDGS